MAWSSHIGHLIGQLAAVIAIVGRVVAADDGVALHTPPVNAAWTALPLREVADQLSRLSGVPVVLDRRIDPATRITLDAAGMPLDMVAKQIATQAPADTAAVVLGSSIRVTPVAAAASCLATERLRTRARARLPAAQRRIIDTAEPWSWDAGARPRDLVATAAAEQSIAIAGLDLIPHDHFPAAEVAALPLADRLDMVLAHFDLRVEWSPGSRGDPPRGRIVTMPAGEPIDTQALQASSAHPTRRPPPPVAADQQVFSMRAEAPLDELLGAVAKRLGLELDLDVKSLQANGISPREIVRIRVEQASREALLDTIAKPLALEWAIENGRLRVGAKHQPP